MFEGRAILCLTGVETVGLESALVEMVLVLKIMDRWTAWNSYPGGVSGARGVQMRPWLRGWRVRLCLICLGARGQNGVCLPAVSSLTCDPYPSTLVVSLYRGSWMPW